MRRGFTMIELMITVSLTAVVLSAVGGIFVFASVRLSDSYTRSSLYDQVTGTADRIEATIRNAQSCSTCDGGSTLVCAMPLKGLDTDEDGYYDMYYPDSDNAQGVEQYSVGDYVWFYQADTTGTYLSGSGGVWRAEVATNTSPAQSNVDRSFAYYDDRIPRYPLVNAVSFSVDSQGRTVSFTVTGSTRIGAETSARADDPSNGRSVSLTRTVAWRN